MTALFRIRRSGAYEGAERRRILPWAGPPLSTPRMYLTGALVWSALVGAILSPRSVEVDHVVLPGSFLVFPLAYTIMAVILEVYGIEVAWRALRMTLVLLAATYLTVQATIAAPIPSGHAGLNAGAEAFRYLYFTPFHALAAGLLGYGVGQSLGLLLFDYLKMRLGRVALTARLFLTPFVSQVLGVAVAAPLLYGALGLRYTVAVVAARLVWAAAYAGFGVPLIFAASMYIRAWEQDRRIVAVRARDGAP